MNPKNWVDNYSDALFRFALLRVRDRAVAEDLVQEAMLGALQSHEQFRGQSTEQTWLIGILRHKIVDHFRRSEREQRSKGSEDRGLDEFFDQKNLWIKAPGNWPSGPLSPAEKAELRRVIDLCASKLPQNLAAVFTLRELEKMETPEICKALHLTPTNLWTRVHRMRMMLRMCLEIHWLGEKPNQITQERNDP